MSQDFLEKCKSLSDNEIAEFINKGEFIYLGVLIERYTPLINGCVSKYRDRGFDSEDLFQEATLALCSAVKSFDPKKASFSTFAGLCVNRALIDVVRATSAKRRVPESLLTPIEDVELSDGASPETILIEKENYRLLADNIRLELSSLEYKVLCAYLTDKSYADIASELGVSIKSVDNTLRRIRTKLK